MTRYAHPVTPAELSPPLAELCRNLVPGAPPPAYVDVRPLDGMPAKECFPIVEEKVAGDGGSRVIGWSLWEMPGIFVEAEFHAVWRAPDGGLLDVSPKARPTRRILFLPDPSGIYEGRQVNNVRRATNGSAEVAAFLRACDDEFEFMNRGARAELHGEIAIEGDEVAEYERIMVRKAEFGSRIARLIPEVGPYTPCTCGSGKKTKWCHGTGK